MPPRSYESQAVAATARRARSRLSPSAKQAAAVAIALVALLGAASYKRWGNGAKRVAAVNASAAQATPALGYMPARWRLATFADVNRVVMWVSHIVVHHEESHFDDPSFRAPGWSPDAPQPKRSKAEALERALLVAELAAKTPDRFAELAKTYSDDAVTRDAGGSLGGVRLGQLPAEYRDALAVLKPGQTSRVMQTALGFHVIKRRPMPDAGDVAGKRIVVRYEGTLSLDSSAPVVRKREAALSLATEVAALATSRAVPFDELVRRHSEGPDAAQLGDMGVWSVRDPEFSPREIEQLAALRIGEVSRPMDSPFGFQVLLRTEVTERPRYAMSAVRFLYDPAKKSGDNSFERVWQRALELAAALKKGTVDFETLQKKHCCVGHEAWALGRGKPALTPVLDALELGEIASAPVRLHGVVMIPKRLDPAALPPAPEASYELPSPAGPDFERLIRDSEPHGLAMMTRQFGAEFERAFRVERATLKESSRRIDDLAGNFEKHAGNADARVRAFQQALNALKTVLGPKYGDFERFLNEWGTRLVIMGHA